MADRAIVYTGALPQATDILNSNKFGMLDTAGLLRGILGTGTVVSDLICSPTSPTADLHVQVGVGSIYTMDQVDATAYGDLGIDTGVVVKQGILNAPVTLTITPPGTPGFSQVYLIQAILNDFDSGPAVIPYYNASNPAQPFSGPDNSGTSQFTVRQTVCAIALKAGAAAATGSQVAPAPDFGFVGLYTITVANGQTQITGANIVPLAAAPRFPTLPSVANSVQNNTWSFGVDTSAVANIYAASVDTFDRAPLTSLMPGTGCFCKIAHDNTGVSTFNLNGLGAITIKRANGVDLQAADLKANMVAAFIFDGTFWQMLNFEGASTTGSTINNTIGIPYCVDTGAANAYVAPFSPAITSLFAGLTVEVKIAHNNTAASTIAVNALGAVAIVDVFGNPLAANVLQANEVALMIYNGTAMQLAYRASPPSPNLQVFTATGTYTPTAGRTAALVICTAAGASGSQFCGGGGGGGAGSTAIALVSLVGLVSAPVTIGAGGPPIFGNNNGGNGGASSFGAFAVAGGGLGGDIQRGGLGGTATVGLLLIAGGDGAGQSSSSGSAGPLFVGGASFWGGGGGGSQSAGGNSGRAPGSGGGGYNGPNPSINASGAGANGVCFVLEF